MSADDEGRLNRWSRLKQRSKAKPGRGAAAPTAEAAADPDIEVAALTEGGTPEGAEQAVEPVVDLPPVESLGKDSDYTPFLQDGVPEELAKAAMRKLWKSDPIFGFRDGLDDYDEDFRTVHTLAEAVTSKLGKAKKDKKKKTAKKEAVEKPVKAAQQTAEKTEDGDAPQTEETEEKTSEAATEAPD